MYQRLRQSATPALSTGMEKPGRVRTESGLNEHLGRHESVTGPPLATKPSQDKNLNERRGKKPVAADYPGYDSDHQKRTITPSEKQPSNAGSSKPNHPDNFSFSPDFVYFMSLTSIAVPCLASDLDDFEKLLTYWSDPRLFPLRDDEPHKPIRLCVVLNRSDDQIAASFCAAFAKYDALHQVFSECVVFDAGLHADRDIYARDEEEPKGIYGNKAGPNFQFFAAIRHLHQYGGFTFLNEVDCYPLRAGWLSDLNALVNARTFAWSIGSYYTGEYPVGQDIQYHFNGNAIYQSGSLQFLKFLDDVWEPRLLDMVGADPNIAYDCWWALEQHKASSVLNNDSWQLVSKYAQFFCNNQFLINTLHEKSAVADACRSLNTAASLDQPCLMLHGHASTQLITGFIASSHTDLPEYIRALDQENQDIEAQPVEENRFSDTEDDNAEILPLWTTQAEREDDTIVPLKAHTPIHIDHFPTSIPVSAIHPDCFIGNWHKDQFSDHIWAGGGGAGLILDFPEPIFSIRITIFGTQPPQATEPLKMNAFGASQVTFSTIRNNQTIIDATDETPFKCLTLVFEGKNTVFIDGDTRDLAFALFRIKANQLSIERPPEP